MTRKYVICFNGPPRSGKDQSATYAAAYLQLLGYAPMHKKFAGILKRSVHYFMNVRYSDKEVDIMKDLPVEHGTQGCTLRDAYISFSEDFAKPVYGGDIFGRLLAREIETGVGDNPDKSSVYLISDAGFISESEPIIDYVGANNYALLQVHRPMCTFDRDSRGYIHPHRGIYRELNNFGTLYDLSETVKAAVDECIRIGNWKP